MTTESLLLIAAIICFILAALPGIRTSLNLTALGLALFTGSFLVR